MSALVLGLRVKYYIFLLTYIVSKIIDFVPSQESLFPLSKLEHKKPSPKCNPFKHSLVQRFTIFFFFHFLLIVGQFGGWRHVRVIHLVTTYRLGSPFILLPPPPPLHYTGTRASLISPLPWKKVINSLTRQLRSKTLAAVTANTILYKLI